MWGMVLNRTRNICRLVSRHGQPQTCRLYTAAVGPLGSGGGSQQPAAGLGSLGLAPRLAAPLQRCSDPAVPHPPPTKQGLAWIGDDKRELRSMLCRWAPAFSKTLMCHLRKGEDLREELEVYGGGGVGVGVVMLFDRCGGAWGNWTLRHELREDGRGGVMPERVNAWQRG